MLSSNLRKRVRRKETHASSIHNNYNTLNLLKVSQSITLNIGSIDISYFNTPITHLLNTKTKSEVSQMVDVPTFYKRK